ncbi:50S ribosomal protein L4 [Candidatus Entotheonellaceae bacterium PAL068K]
MQVDVYNVQGEVVRQTELSDAVFMVEVKEHLLHEVVRYQLARRRQGTAHTKNRAAVRGGGRKPWRQKGTGRARAGSNRSPLWRGGGTVFGPMPRTYAFSMPKKKRRAALCSALSLKVHDQAFHVIERFEVSQPKTRQVVDMVKRFTDQPKVLLLVGEPYESLHLSARNIPHVKVLPVAGLNVYDLLHYTTVICAEGALEKIVGRLT